MYCVIFGAGEVGSHMAEILDRKGYRLSVVDNNAESVQKLANKVDARPIIGSIMNRDVLISAEVENADLVLCVTNQDAENILGAMLSKKLGAKTVIARARSDDFIAGREDTFHQDFGIDDILSPEVLAAEEICKRIKTPGVSAIEFFADGKVGLREHTVPSDSDMIGIPFKDLDIGSKILITAVFRHGETIIPNGDTSFEADDHFFIVGITEDVEGFGRQFGDVPTPKRRVIIYGGTAIGAKLALMLEDSGISVKLIEADREKCHKISEMLEKTLVLNGSGLDADFLLQSGIAESDAFIAASDQDEHNIVSALIATEHGASETVAVVEQASFVPVARRLGVHAAMSPRLVTASRVMRSILPDRIKSLAILSEHEVDVLEVHVRADDKIVGKRLKKLSMPRDTVIAAIVRGDDVVVPHGEDTINENDIVIVFTLSKNLTAVERLF